MIEQVITEQNLGEKLRLARLRPLSRIAFWGIPMSCVLGILILIDDSSTWMTSGTPAIRLLLSVVALFCAVHYSILYLVVTKYLKDHESIPYKILIKYCPGYLDIIGLLLIFPVMLNMLFGLIYVSEMPIVYYFFFVASLSTVLVMNYKPMVFLSSIVSFCIICAMPAAGLIKLNGPGNIDLLWILLLVNWNLYFVYKSRKDISDSYTGVIQSNRDLTEEISKLERLSKERLAYVSRISHELRSPLHGMLAYVQLLDRDSELSDSQRKHVETIERNLLHLREMINQVLDFSHIESGYISTLVEPVDVVMLLQEVKSLYDIEAKQSAIDIFIDVSREVDENMPILTDSVKYRQILMNLVGNAVKYSEQGHIWIKLSIDEVLDGRALSGKFASLKCVVADSGGGIPESQQKLIFDPYKRVDGGDVSVEGTGLGLPISKMLANMLDGDIELTSLEGMGSRFTFWVPLNTCTEDYETLKSKLDTANGAEAPVERGDGYDESTINSLVVKQTEENYSDRGDETHDEQLRILIVDDSEMARNLMREILEEYNCIVETVDDGEDAIRKVESWGPNLIFMDSRMPIINGVDAVKRIRALPQQAYPYIVGCTGNAFEKEQQEFINAGANAVLAKPFTIDSVVTILLKCMREEDTR